MLISGFFLAAFSVINIIFLLGTSTIAIASSIILICFGSRIKTQVSETEIDEDIIKKIKIISICSLITAIISCIACLMAILPIICLVKNSKARKMFIQGEYDEVVRKLKSELKLLTVSNSIVLGIVGANLLTGGGIYFLIFLFVLKIISLWVV